MRGKRLAPIEQGDVLGCGHAVVCTAGQQNAQFFKAFTNGGYGLRQVQIALGGPAQSLRMRACIEGVNATAWKHISARRKTGCERAPCHEDFDALVGVAQQQDGGSRPCRGRFSLGV